MSLGTVQDKVTVCATNDSYQVTRERMAQAEEDSRKRGTKVLKPVGQFRGKFHALIYPPTVVFSQAGSYYSKMALFS